MEEQPRNRWHNILAALLMQVWPEVGIEVLTDIKVLQEPPEVDFVLLRRHTPTWTVEQRARLPDGVRDSTASHILIEFKYTDLFFGLSQLWFGSRSKESMQQATISPPTPEIIQALGREYREMMLKFYRPKELVDQLTPDEIATNLSPEQRKVLRKLLLSEDEEKSNNQT